MAGHVEISSSDMTPHAATMPTQQTSYVSNDRIGTFFANEDTFATTLLALCLDRYGTEVFDWDVRTLNMALAEDFSVETPRVNLDKIQALILVHTTNMVFVSLEAFVHVCNVLSGSEANFQHWDHLTPEEALWGLYEIALHAGIDRNDGDMPDEFNNEIRQYLGVVARNAGLLNPPDLLRIADTQDAHRRVEDWQEDPVFVKAIHDNNKARNNELMLFLADRVEALVSEMTAVPLQFRSDDWNKFAQSTTTVVSRIRHDAQPAA